MTTFDLWPLPLGGGAWGAGTNIWLPETPPSYESLPAPLATQIPTLWIHTPGGRGRGGALILDRCRAFDLFASVDAHLWYSSPPQTTTTPGISNIRTAIVCKKWKKGRFLPFLQIIIIIIIIGGRRGLHSDPSALHWFYLQKKRYKKLLTQLAAFTVIKNNF